MKAIQLLLFLLLWGGGLYGQNYSLVVNETIEECTIRLEIMTLDATGAKTITPPSPTSDEHSTIKYFIEWGDEQSDYIEEDPSGLTTFSHNYVYDTENSLLVKANYIYSDGDEPDLYKIPNRDLLLKLSDCQIDGGRRNVTDLPAFPPQINFRFEEIPAINKQSTGIIEYWGGDGLPNYGMIKFYYNDVNNGSRGFNFLSDNGRETRHRIGDEFIENRATNSNDLQLGFDSVMVWEFSDLFGLEFRTIFFDLFATDKILGSETETSQEVEFVAEIDFGTADGNNLFLATAQPSVYIARDPNLMITSQIEIPLEDQIVEYKVQFQNIGAANVGTVIINLDLAPELDVTTIQPKDFHPKRFNSDAKMELNGTQIILTNLSMPGSNQKNPDNNDALFSYEESIGYVTFEVAHKARAEQANYQLLSFAEVEFKGLGVIQTNTAITNVIAPNIPPPPPPSYKILDYIICLVVIVPIIFCLSIYGLIVRRAKKGHNHRMKN